LAHLPAIENDYLTNLCSILEIITKNHKNVLNHYSFSIWTLKVGLYIEFKKDYLLTIYIVTMSEVGYCDKFFHKYRPIDENTESLLKNNEIFFSCPDNFNDPFDCKLDSFHKGTHSEWVDFFCRHKMHPAMAKNLIKENLKNGNMKQKRDGILFENKTKLKGYSDDGTFLRACCFSERKDSLLMWSHYAKNHEGICLSFKSLSVGEYYLLPLASDYALPFHEIDYKDIKPKPVNLMNRDEEETKSIITDFYLTKFTDWHYEREYRLLATINDRAGKSTVNFQKDALEGVTFGLKVKPDKAQLIKDIIDQYYAGIDVKLYRTEKVDGKYAIYFKEIRDFDKYVTLLDKA
jgi:Protein of unknown function (DUF2971).